MIPRQIASCPFLPLQSHEGQSACYLIPDYAVLRANQVPVREASGGKGGSAVPAGLSAAVRASQGVGGYAGPLEKPAANVSLAAHLDTPYQGNPSSQLFYGVASLPTLAPELCIRNEKMLAQHLNQLTVHLASRRDSYPPSKYFPPQRLNL